MPGVDASPVEVVQVTRFGIWLAVDVDEYYLDYTRFPWFKRAAIADICEIETPVPGHFYWPTLDIDLDIECIRRPEDYPLIAT